MAQIENREDLRNWLEEKPIEWSQTLAARTALRSVPYGVGESSKEPARLSLVRASALSWAARNVPANGLLAAHRAADDAGLHGSPQLSWAAIGAVRAAGFAAKSAHFDIDRSGSAGQAAYDAGYFATFDEANRFNARIFAAIEMDATLLEEAGELGPTARELLGTQLWITPPPDDWFKRWSEARQWLFDNNPTYIVWIEWFDRRIRGEASAFYIPGDKGREEDKAILIRLAESTDEQFWDKGAEHVNTTLQRWIDEARERAAANLPAFIDEIDLDALEPDPKLS